MGNHDRPGDYSDIIDLPHHVSTRHPHMSRVDRAAQFGSFDPLKDYKDSLAEEKRQTEERPELSDEDLARLNEAVRKLAEQTSGDTPAHPKVTLTIFIPDDKKTGGSIKTTTGHVRTVNEELRYIVLENGRRYPFRDLLRIE